MNTINILMLKELAKTIQLVISSIENGYEVSFDDEEHEAIKNQYPEHSIFARKQSTSEWEFFALPRKHILALMMITDN